ncbi:cytochrome c [Pseudomaricurvus alkylphenolicus]|nr:cytochrome c [Pseudomaricurvus alkylphenolicus]
MDRADAAVSQDADTIRRGAYLAAAADCVACHTSDDGLAFAGGTPLHTPFGTIYGTNITPDKRHGIGFYDADEFFRAVVHGRARDGRHLYPAMPYTSYRDLTREDVDAIYAYLMDLAPINLPNKPHELSWPFSMTWTLAFWNSLFVPNQSLFMKSEEFQAPSSQWRRGEYLSTALGHCGECHTPRNLMGAVDPGNALNGAFLEGFEAPDISTAGLIERGWSSPDLLQFLKTGISRQGTMTDEMFPVLKHSTQYLKDVDAQAMVAYLIGDQPRRIEQELGFDPSLENGRQTYLDLCSGCHAPDGEGIPHVAVAMTTNTSLRFENPRNLILVILKGIEEQDFPGLEHMQAMPGYQSSLNDQEVAELGNYLRVTWGGKSASITASDIRELR